MGRFEDLPGTCRLVAQEQPSFRQIIVIWVLTSFGVLVHIFLQPTLIECHFSQSQMSSPFVLVEGDVQRLLPRGSGKRVFEEKTMSNTNRNQVQADRLLQRVRHYRLSAGLLEVLHLL